MPKTRALVFQLLLPAQFFSRFCRPWNGCLCCKTELGVWVPWASFHHSANPASAFRSSLWNTLGPKKPRYKKLKGKHATERCNEDGKTNNNSLFLRPSCMPGSMLSTDFPRKEQQVVMSESVVPTAENTWKGHRVVYRQSIWQDLFLTVVVLSLLVLLKWVSLQWDQEKEK